MEVSFLLGPGEGDRLRWWGTPEMIPLSLIPTRGAACRREPLERARSNRRSHGAHPRRGMSARTLRTSAKQPEKPRWTGSGRRHAGISQEKENLRCVPGVPGAVAWRTELLQAEFRVRKACRKKERPPVPFGKDTEGDRGTEFLAAWFQNPNFAGAAPCASPGSFKGFMRTMPPGRWGAAMEVSFLLGPGEGDRLRWWGTSPCTFKQKRCHNR